MLTTLIIFVVLLGALVFVHELGHFLTAKRSGARVEEFGFGFPPRLFGIRRGGTLYSINALPLGGFVRIKGESGADAAAPDSFAALPAFRRALILTSGVLMNVLLAMLLLSFLFVSGAPASLDQPLPKGAVVSNLRVQVVQVAPDSTAARAGLRAGDTIQAVDGMPITTVAQVQDYNADHANIAEEVTVVRGRTRLTLSLTPTTLATSPERAVWGVGLLETGTVAFPWYQALWLGATRTIGLLWQIVLGFFALLQGLVLRQQVIADVAGPVGIAAMTGQVAELGFAYLLQFAALLSLNLAFINILPIPALDGGRVLFLIIEKIRRKRLSPRTELLIHNIGFACLMVLVLAVTIRDVNRFSGAIAAFFQRLLGVNG